QNKDWTQIDANPQGTKHYQVAKHMLETAKMARHPQQELLNKLGYIPSETANIALGTEYLHPRTNPRTGEVTAGPPMRTDPVTHALKNLLPFSFQARGAEGQLETALSVTGLMQISGMTPKQLEEEKE